MIRLYLEFILLLVIFCSCNSTSSDVERKYLHLSKADLENKIKGGWVGQTIGVILEDFYNHFISKQF